MPKKPARKAARVVAYVVWNGKVIKRIDLSREVAALVRHMLSNLKGR